MFWGSTDSMVTILDNAGGIYLKVAEESESLITLEYKSVSKPTYCMP